MQQITIDQEFKALIPPLAADERQQLEENIKRDGCRDPLVVWNGVLLDGHNRYEICTRLGIGFEVFQIQLEDKAAALDWMEENQLGRRNLSPEQMSLLRGRMYNRKKKGRGAPEGNANRTIQKDQNDPIESRSTAEVLAEKHGVSAPTIKRDGKFAESVESLKEFVPDVEERIMSGEVKRRDVLEAAQEPEKAQEILAHNHQQKHVHVSANSGNNEWYTPPEFIELARTAMGSIDTDPATSEFANQAVRAPLYFTADTDGRDKQWRGNVWMNPPYSQPLISEFCDAAVTKYLAGEIEQACILVNNATETGWFQRLLDGASAVAFLKGRVRYLDSQGNPANTPLQGQAIVYMGKNADGFAEVFSGRGRVLKNG